MGAERGEGGSSYLEVRCSKALSRSRLPGLDWALNPYIGCEHACVYCYAPSILHVDREKWGTFVKIRRGISSVLERELKGRTGTIGLGTITDPYQPIERRGRLTRRCLEVISRSDLKVSVHTKSDMVVRDLDLLHMNNSEVGVTITSLDPSVARGFEPEAPLPEKRIDALSKLVQNGIDSYALLGPLLPVVIDRDISGFVKTLAGTGIERVMLDPLRLRPGILDHIRDREEISECIDVERFSRLARSRNYFFDVQRRLTRLFKNEGVKCVNAF